MTTLPLSGQRAIVTGVSGNVGWGVAKALLIAGADVVAVSRSSTLDSVAASLGLGEETRARLQVEHTDFSDSSSALQLRDRLMRSGGLNHAFISLGSWWQRGLIVDQSPAEYASVRGSLLDAQVHAAMALVPLLRHRDGATYTLVTGAAGHMSIPNTGLLVASVAGVMGLSRMLRAEHVQDAVRINEVLIETRIEREWRDGVVPSLAFGEAIVGMMGGSKRSEVLRFGGEGWTR